MAALAAVSAGTAGPAEVWAALGPARVYAAGVYLPEQGQLALVALRAAGGLTAVPVFIDIPALLRWRPDARPLARTGRDLAAIAVAEGYAALVVGPGDPAEIAVPADVLADLARGFVPSGERPGLATRRTTGAPTLRPAATLPGPRLRTVLTEALRRPLAAGRVVAVYAVDVVETEPTVDGPVPALGVAGDAGDPLEQICLELADRLASLLRAAVEHEGDTAQLDASGDEPAYAVLALGDGVLAALPDGVHQLWPEPPRRTW